MKRSGRSKSYVSNTEHISNSRNKKLSLGQRYDILGNIIITDTDSKAVARKLLSLHKNATTVIAKAGAISGKYRTRKFKYVLGKKTFVATYKENGCIFKFDVRKTFFSSRLSYERARVRDLVKEKENVVVFFSGVGPFAIEIAKKRANVVGIELNKYASKMAKENTRFNKVNVTCETGDVRKIAEKYKNFADRIVMPLPRLSMEFLDDAFAVSKKTAIIHLYAFGNKDTAFKDLTKKLKDHAKKKKYKIKIIFKRQVRTYSAFEIEVVIDYKISKA